MDNVLNIFAPFEELTKEIISTTAAVEVIPNVIALKQLLQRQASMIGTAKAALLEAVVRRFNNTDLELDHYSF